ncbi:hypothetical protein [Parabacteroides distasonis]|uniref:hypothetical protein n=1 Tax=Parabacteroides distasonis TaxID=823 RepID=UPI000E364677|nr:hypothetical protein [Parabacteroides distasonis]REC36748.1 hypothetical protein CF162_19865 [Parabacteroides distasonis]
MSFFNPLDLAPQLPVHHGELLFHGHAVIEVYGRVLYIDPVKVSPVTLQLGPVLGTDHGEVAYLAFSVSCVETPVIPSYTAMNGAP